jgi:segregation and condensation protein A
VTAYAYRSDHFDGPLDALLSLIEERKLSVSQVSLSEVCDGYLSYVESLPDLPLGETSQFILIASTLLLIKSRALLPTVVLSDDETHSIEELEHRLAHYAKIRAASKLLRAIWGSAPLILQRRAPSLMQQGRTKIAFNPGETSVAALLRAAQKVIASFPKPEKMSEASVMPVIALEDVVRKISERVRLGLRTRWSELTRSAGKHEAIVHFLAILELVRHGSLSVTQDKLFSDILIESEIITTPRY